MAREDAPLGGVEVVGAVADVFHEAERASAVGEQYESARCAVG